MTSGLLVKQKTTTKLHLISCAVTTSHHHPRTQTRTNRAGCLLPQTLYAIVTTTQLRRHHLQPPTSSSPTTTSRRHPQPRLLSLTTATATIPPDPSLKRLHGVFTLQHMFSMYSVWWLLI
ncbi:unnamed protein product [Lactuca virosa]|uniref:Uncharacterized protein n=1 Tax=Lactuca virosa TaxID=75947 RepID=A0AAU9MEI9_9ASTR|nr:unnamed protein product [Lactuca virosa]